MFYYVVGATTIAICLAALCLMRRPAHREIDVRRLSDAWLAQERGRR